MSTRLSRRAMLALAAILIIAIGLTTRLPGIAWPPIVAKYLGSALWGAMVYCLVAFLRPQWRMTSVALLAACIAATIEASQLWHPPWLDAFRETRLGVLLLGRFFAWADIAAYLVGISVAAVSDRSLSPAVDARRSEA
ncbi:MULTISPECIES: DUF2809 domain-containing protein [unclassified Bosea (in: a-proteobacteria)]|uniref:ribosomal maturation YjgA family protein n=1 Tax=unclassified Bosea (in: a-proteobacteria) TaxID=2653178 RepID=UPI001F36D67B|nr:MULTISPECIES: DUF2809 domain-containing protein [unclassified Bosea (in: a-proteobacteria)]